jgi:hypothetical protein
VVRPSPARGRAGPRLRVLAVTAALIALGLALGGRPPVTVPGGEGGEGGADAPSAGLAVGGVEAGEGSPQARPTDPGLFSPTGPRPRGPDAARHASTPPPTRPLPHGEALGDAARRSDATPPEPERAERPDIVAEAPEGFGVLAGAASAGSGERRTFTVEVEEGFEEHAAELLDTIGSALLDVESSWARDHNLAQVEDPGAADIRVVLASPTTVDEWCGAVGLDTGGDSSCWDGERAMLNGDRWRHGVDHVDDLETYRAYLVNHEVGHGLGHGHVDCPEPGAAAPVMMQQTLGLGGCHPNPWPYP